MKGWYAALCALPLLAPGAWADDDLNGAAVSLARKTAVFAGRGESISLAYRNLSSLGSAELAQARSSFEAALREAGARPVDAGTQAVDARVSLSENFSQYLLVVEAHKGEDRQVWIASWPRAAPSIKSSGISLDRKQVWRQTEAILDVAFLSAGMLVLSPSKIALYTQNNDRWELRQFVPLAPAKPWPRDLRGHIRPKGSAFEIFLPGMACSGNSEPVLSMECRASDAPWVLESGGRALLLANYAASRNYFDGRIVTQSGARKTMPPFYSAAAAESQGRGVWFLTQLDGRTVVTDAAFEPMGGAAAISTWGSDIVGIDSHCGPSTQIVATRASDAGEMDAIMSYAISGGMPAPVTAPVPFPGPVVALWPSGPSAALAVARDLTSGDFIAYVVTITCGP